MTVVGSAAEGPGTEPTDGRTYRKTLRLFELVSLGVGGTIGSGIFVVPGLAAGIAGSASLVAWSVVAVSACSVAFSLASIQSHAPAGTPFTKLFAPVFGARIGVILASMYLVSAVFGIATIAAGMGQYFSYFSVSHVLATELLIIGAFGVVNLVGIALSGRTENLLTVIKVAAIIVIAFALTPYIRLENLMPLRAPSWSALLDVVVIVYWPFSGFEISAIPLAETRNPAEISRALLVVMLLVCAIYLGLNVALIGSVGADALAASKAPLADTVGRVFNGAGPFVAALAIVTMLSALNAYIVATSRVLQSLAETLAVTPLAALSRRGAPAAALVVSCAASSGLLLFSNRFADLATVAVLMTLLPYVAICASAFGSTKSSLVRGVSLLGGMLTTLILTLYLVL